MLGYCRADGMAHYPRSMTEHVGALMVVEVRQRLHDKYISSIISIIAQSSLHTQPPESNTQPGIPVAHPVFEQREPYHRILSQ